jgi:hypothetical protein
VDEGSEPSGIERAAQQGIGAFQAEQFTDPVPAVPPAPIGPPIGSVIDNPANALFTRPHFMEGAWFVSTDRMSWWNGTTWVPGRPPASSHAGNATTPDPPGSTSAATPLILFVAGLAAMAAIAFIAWQAFQAMPTLTPTP